jgi:hypothetical protein
LATVELWARPPGAGAFAKVATDSSPSASGSFAYTAAAGDGSYAFYTRATDAAGNYEEAPTSADATTLVEPQQDTTPPDTTITAGPSGPTSDATPTFSFSSSESGSSFECRIDSATFAPCSSPYTTTALSDGSHSFEVRAIDSAENVDPSPAARSFSVEAAFLEPVTPQVIAPSALVPPTMPFAFLAVRSTPRNGGAILLVRVAVPGSLVVFGRRVKKAVRQASRPGIVALPVRPKGGSRRLRTAKVDVTFTPLGGSPTIRRTTVRFRRAS